MVPTWIFVALCEISAILLMSAPALFRYRDEHQRAIYFGSAGIAFAIFQVLWLLENGPESLHSMPTPITWLWVGPLLLGALTFLWGLSRRDLYGLQEH